MWAKRVALKFMCHCKMFVTPGLTKIKDYSVPLHGVPRFVLLQGLLRCVLPRSYKDLCATVVHDVQ